MDLRRGGGHHTALTPHPIHAHTHAVLQAGQELLVDPDACATRGHGVVAVGPFSPRTPPPRPCPHAYLVSHDTLCGTPVRWPRWWAGGSRISPFPTKRRTDVKSGKALHCFFPMAPSHSCWQPQMGTATRQHTHTRPGLYTTPHTHTHTRGGPRSPPSRATKPLRATSGGSTTAGRAVIIRLPARRPRLSWRP